MDSDEALETLITFAGNSDYSLRAFGRYREAIQKAKTDAQALADVRTLDAFNRDWRMGPSPEGNHFCMPRGDTIAFEGKTEDEARSKAAAWIRGEFFSPSEVFLKKETA